ncbi:F-actin-capping protein subunit alpha [Lipomyces oligophaga]|uniref:F-actin-capping protein subunit alpha n=1 Tax=Lipomyces oligophaga TaxID=45792 RepID=UPI0034CE9733
MSSQAKVKIVSAFLTDAPPGEIKDVYDDIRAIVEDDSKVLDGLDQVFQQYNLDQFVTVKVPGSSKPIVISPYNSLGETIFYDGEAGKQFELDHRTLKVSGVESYEEPTTNSELISSLKYYVSEHYPEPSAYGLFSQEDDTIAIVISGNKYSPSNFWNGRWRSSYTVDLSSGLGKGQIDLDVHYYEDGNVRLKTKKIVDLKVIGGDVIKAIASAERAYQEELNKEFSGLSDGAFKALRRQLPVTRSKIEWGKSIGAYRLGQDIGGGRTAN